ncbi:hypothetical protein D9M71_652010 [compost metagenome]
MAKQVIKFVADDGKEFDTLEAAEHHERVSGLAMALGEFHERFPEDGFDTMGCAEWLMKTFTMERR